MTIIDKLISDGIINEEDKETVIARDCPFQYGYKDNHISSNSLSACEKCWNMEADSSSSSDDSSSESESKEKSTPVNDVIISKVSVETYGVDYGKPDTLETWNYYDWVYKTYGINLKQYQQ